jgi:hypothetical protein
MSWRTHDATQGDGSNNNADPRRRQRSWEVDVQRALRGDALGI